MHATASLLDFISYETLSLAASVSVVRLGCTPDTYAEPCEIFKVGIASLPNIILMLGDPTTSTSWASLADKMLPVFTRRTLPGKCSVFQLCWCIEPIPDIMWLVCSLAVV